MVSMDCIPGSSLNLEKDRNCQVLAGPAGGAQRSEPLSGVETGVDHCVLAQDLNYKTNNQGGPYQI